MILKLTRTISLGIFGLSVLLLLVAGCQRRADSGGARPAPDTEVTEVRLARQYGLGYLPLIVMEQQHLVERQAKAAGLGEITTKWITVAGGAAAADALLSGSVDYIATGVPPLITLWEKSGKEVRGVAALDASPILLNTVNPGVKSLRDFTERDRIALPAVKVSVQAVVLEMAAAKEFGSSNFSRLDALTVTMRHPDALASLLSGHSEVSAHLASPPFASAELQNGRVHSVLNSFELLGGPHTFDVLSTTRHFYTHNPKTYAAVLAALDEAISLIENDKSAAAKAYVSAEKSRESAEQIAALLSDSSIAYTSTPQNVEKFSDFLHQVGAIKQQPGWKDLFFEPLHNRNGS